MAKKKSVKEELKEKLRKSQKNSAPTVVNFILDKSGSMSSMRETVIDGFNEYVDNLRDKPNILFSFTLFDSDDVEHRYVVEPVKDVDELTRDNYVPGAATPLFDAVCSTIYASRDKLDKAYKKYSSLVVVMTDGMENASQEYSMQDFVKLKKELEGKGNWTFVFMGANQDAWATAQQWGLSRGNTLSWDASASGASKAMRSLADNTVMYASAMSNGGGGGGSTTAFFSGSTDVSNGTGGGQKNK